ncbi:SdpI family protein [Curtobacterium flaccumfaciens pv. oortii]|uniref:SdpI family protein n=1 Tax=Curtobacterium flaccumfaciens TaxID=2035 RepID=UPI001BDE592B|nr:SdpI family protein [Curtobacterium flaccumfaciens]MBT1623517.1 SdpI family protein [Curtobacterium flaccumfaciens pv. oortii]
MIVVELVAAVMTMVFAVFPAKGMLRRNAFIGVRTRSTMRDDAAWQIGHRAAVLPTTIAGGVTIVVGLVFIAVGRVNDPGSVVVCAVPLVIGALWSVVAAGRAIR